MPIKEHASLSFNLPNYVASRQEKFQEFLRRPGYSVSSREDEVPDGNCCRKPGNASIGSKQAQDMAMAAGEVPCRGGSRTAPTDCAFMYIRLNGIIWK